MVSIPYSEKKTRIVLISPPVNIGVQAGSLKDIANIIMPLGI